MWKTRDDGHGSSSASSSPIHRHRHSRMRSRASGGGRSITELKKRRVVGGAGTALSRLASLLSLMTVLCLGDDSGTRSLPEMIRTDLSRMPMCFTLVHNKARASSCTLCHETPHRPAMPFPRQHKEATSLHHLHTPRLGARKPLHSTKTAKTTTTKNTATLCPLP